jgi:hypothetical protein
MATMPHCDSRVLHAPGECEYCDGWPQAQQYRQITRIAFTGHDPQPGELPCPSTLTRSLTDIEHWPGNRAKPPPDSSWLTTPELCREDAYTSFWDRLRIRAVKRRWNRPSR